MVEIGEKKLFFILYNDYVTDEIANIQQEREIFMNSKENIVKEENTYMQMSNEEYRKEIISIFTKMNRNDRLRFWYRYISAMEKGED